MVDDIAALVARLRAGDPRAVARVISWVEDDAPQLPEIAAALTRQGNDEHRSHLVGMTGAPGVGKSTTTSCLVTALRERGDRVGVLAVDPSSPFTGGALLGDRVRMQEHATDAGVFIRSMASRGHLGGLAAATPQAARVLAAAGCDEIVVETVGVGQSEVEVAALADTTVVVIAPGMGDAVQAAKAGILEIADVFVVNKADRDGADIAVRELRTMVGHGRVGDATPGQWRQPIISTVATQGRGIADLVEAIGAHRDHLATSGEGERRRLRRHAAEIAALAWQKWHVRWFSGLAPVGELAELAQRVADGQLDPYRAAEELLRRDRD